MVQGTVHLVLLEDAAGRGITSATGPPARVLRLPLSYIASASTSTRRLQSRYIACNTVLRPTGESGACTGRRDRACRVAVNIGGEYHNSTKASDHGISVQRLEILEYAWKAAEDPHVQALYRIPSA
ncbi:hypothetical protein CERZMDRAFT_91292 [Cercospora zeae-maydis SCOH1-5]|uniref:Uncharacterized protein n=1 Tax=Cercospora zeae-maydis SCOH1-5 TaxID=717836 RepID=A0A6A6F6W7_9PEZI|nr:hypothetical protein CERZMDRAFT_91292 [Cercospora zeae-maydis SCOH1-5]